MKNLLIFASGTREGGGSGFQILVENTKTGILDVHIVAAVSNHEHGGVRAYADSLRIPFEYFPSPYTKGSYKEIVSKYNADFVSLSGWLKLVHGLDPKRTINIHPGPLPQFGGDDMYGQRVHEAVIAEFRKGNVQNSAVSMHFVTEDYDAGPMFFRYPVKIRYDDTPETLGVRVNAIEYAWQSFITNLVIQEKIKWDGKDPKSLVVPSWYPFSL